MILSFTCLKFLIATYWPQQKSPNYLSVLRDPPWSNFCFCPLRSGRCFLAVSANNAKLLSAPYCRARLCAASSLKLPPRMNAHSPLTFEETPSVLGRFPRSSKTESVAGVPTHPFPYSYWNTHYITLFVLGSLLDNKFPNIPGTQQKLGTWWEFMKRNKWIRHFSFLSIQLFTILYII